MVKFRFIHCFTIWIAHTTFLPLAFSASFLPSLQTHFIFLHFPWFCCKEKGRNLCSGFLSIVFLRGSMWLLLSFFSLVFFFPFKQQDTKMCSKFRFSVSSKMASFKSLSEKVLIHFLTLLVKMSIYWDQRGKFIMPLGCLTKDYQYFVSFFLLK